ncbi:type III-A CRISPR-associated protein Csm2 [Thermohalobacter berrensis]|uniref:CRISPR system Cms protein Csm2 n=1 Tax=Thermohalobacter berrensis TaxID=99594 RepID=A0A419T1F3_9FIRM|nr:type III-A CRISPR-associated protein Csm2 [Thermohalobacter berrensis]RKD31283.1 type III-A CRISPR-associated protein Csm2 [Thermohalobacter berrensis]
MSRYNRGRNKNYRNPLSQLIKEIQKAKSLKEVFVPEKYALPDGWAFKTANTLIGSNAMNTNQIRKIFGELKSIEEKLKREKDLDKCKNDILLIMPQVAYALGRRVVSKNFYDLMKECINLNKIKEPEDFIAFVKFFTAVVAYSSVVKSK